MQRRLDDMNQFGSVVARTAVPRRAAPGLPTGRIIVKDGPTQSARHPVRAIAELATGPSPHGIRHLREERIPSERELGVSPDAAHEDPATLQARIEAVAGGVPLDDRHHARNLFPGELHRA